VHIIAPAIEKTAEQVAELLSAVQGERIPPELEALTNAARTQLRETFLNADVGITGANFGVSSTGSICLVTNEGNARLVSSIPRVHVAIMGMERLVPTTATSRAAAPACSVGHGAEALRLHDAPHRAAPRGETTAGGDARCHPRQRPVEPAARPLPRDAGVHPLRGLPERVPGVPQGGGAAYGPVYSGPMGAVLLPLLVGLREAPSLPHASSLCGACTAACPVKIPLHELLLDLRRDLVEEGVAPWWERAGFTLWSWAWSSALGYRLSTALARLGQPLAGWPGRAGLVAGRSLPRSGGGYRDRRS
jgi:L-lactate dehydrogenase complex protein LldF